MLDDLKAAARRIAVDRPLRQVLADCARLLSVSGEANGPLLAQTIVERL